MSFCASRGWWTRCGAGAVALALMAAACGDDGGDAVGEGGPEAPEGMVHVHGLGINPADDQLYVATHYGLFRLDGDGEAERLGPVQDIMGFTVVGADHFVGSGHPGAAMMQEGVVNPLGLIETNNSGETWETQSLSGEVDFHALTYAHDTIYGWNASRGQLLVSADGEEWEQRSVVSLISLAVDPDDADRLVATVPPSDGSVMVSPDGGVTWIDQDGADDLALLWLAWDADQGLWAAAEEGELYRTDDPEAGTWESAGEVEGLPMALYADADTVYVASMRPDDGSTLISASTDGGATWDILYDGE